MSEYTYTRDLLSNGQYNLDARVARDVKTQWPSKVFTVSCEGASASFEFEDALTTGEQATLSTIVAGFKSVVGSGTVTLPDVLEDDPFFEEEVYENNLLMKVTLYEKEVDDWEFATKVKEIEYIYDGTTLVGDIVRRFDRYGDITEEQEFEYYTESSGLFGLGETSIKRRKV